MQELALTGERERTRELELTSDWRDAFILTKDAVTPGDRTALRRRAVAGELVRILPGHYLESERVDAMTADARYLWQVRAVAVAYGHRPVFSQHSAAALWGLPMVGRWPDTVHSVDARAPGGRSDKYLRRHCVGEPGEWEVIDGMRSTVLARTVVDVARLMRFGAAVAMADRALQGAERVGGVVGPTTVAREDLVAELARLSPIAGSARCRQVIEFADGASGSPGESISRAGIRLLGLTAPELQVPFRDADGLIGFVDFWWPQFNVIGEFDGRVKYLRDEYTKGRSAADVVVDEKMREDRLRALGHGVVRWDWRVASSLPRLRERLVRAGIR